ncbi:unnamed protein product, partial [Timema podura]|nr:unnamed protein product [Timema podura]
FAAGTRRQSLAKLYNLQIQAPITRIIELINSAQEEAAEPVVQILDKSAAFYTLCCDICVIVIIIGRYISNNICRSSDRGLKVRGSIPCACEITDALWVACLQVIDIVRTTELYTPHMKERPIKLTDPVTSDLISALLMVAGCRLNVVSAKQAPQVRGMATIEKSRGCEVS